MTLRKIGIIGIIVFIILTVIGNYIVKQMKEKEDLIAILKADNQNFASIINDDQLVISRQDQRITTLNNAVEANLIDLQALKAKGIKDAELILNLKTENARLRLEATYDKPPVIIRDTVYVDGVPQVSEYLKIPQPWKFSDKWTSINGEVKSTGVTIDSLITYSEPSIIMGYTKGFLKKSKPIIDYSDSNPYSKVKDMTNVVIVKKPPFYKTPWFHRLEGAAGILVIQWGMGQMSNQK